MKRGRTLAVLLFVAGLSLASTAGAAPIITLTNSDVNGAGQFFAEFLIEDPGGLSSVDVSLLSNISISPLQPGNNLLFGATSVTLTATAIVQTALADLGLTAFSVTGAATHAQFVIDPVDQEVTTAVAPEPASLLVLTTGVVGLAVRGRTKRLA